MIKFEEIVKKFQIEGEITDINPLGHGKVNHTYEVVCGGEHYVLQEMNHIMFRYPTEVMNNLFQVTEYLRQIIAQEGRDPDLETLTYIRTKSGNQLHQTEDGNYYRLYRMIMCGKTMKKPQTGEEAFQAAHALGTFHRRLRDFDVRQLSSTVPRLHDMKYALGQMVDAVRADICFRTSDCQEQIQFVLERSDKLNRIRDAVNRGEIPLRVTHNDSRYVNVLADLDNGKAICLIDLDTVMPGVSVLDFGDAVRSGAATYGEDEKFGNIELDLDLYKAYLQGYATEMSRVLNDTEKQLISYGVWLMAMEKGMQYLTDYLGGDRDMRDFSDERQNLFRAVNQFFLVLDIEEKMEKMDEIVRFVFEKK